MSISAVPPDMVDQFKALEQDAIAMCDANLGPLLSHRIWLQDRLGRLQDMLQPPAGSSGPLPAFNPAVAKEKGEREAELKALQAQIEAHPDGPAYLEWEKNTVAVFESRTSSFSAVRDAPAFPLPPSATATSSWPGPGHPSGPMRPVTAPGPAYEVPQDDRPGYANRSGPSTGGFGPPPVRRSAGPRPVPDPRRAGGRGPVPPGMRPRSGPPAGLPPGNPRGHPGPRGRQQLAPRSSARIIPPGATQPAVRGTGGNTGRTMLILFLVVLAVAAAAFGLSRARGGSSGYGGSVDQVKSWVNTACQNHNTAWPGDVNFACDTKQGKNILWVFALMSSNSNPDYAGKPAAKGQEARVGLLPVPPTGAAQHYVPALGLDHVYNPKNPIDSLQVGALILNTDVGGTVNFGGVQGLESNPNNCVRYTGSAQQTTLASGLKICTQNLTPQGQQSLVEDLWLRWNIPGSDQAAQKEASTAAQCAAVLYSSPDSPNANAQAALTWIEKEHQKGKLLV